MAQRRIPTQTGQRDAPNLRHKVTLSHLIAGESVTGFDDDNVIECVVMKGNDPLIFYAEIVTTSPPSFFSPAFESGVKSKTFVTLRRNAIRKAREMGLLQGRVIKVNVVKVNEYDLGEIYVVEGEDDTRLDFCADYITFRCESLREGEH